MPKREREREAKTARERERVRERERGEERERERVRERDRYYGRGTVTRPGCVGTGFDRENFSHNRTGGERATTPCAQQKDRLS